jgi:uncharacterized protein YkwD
MRLKACGRRARDRTARIVIALGATLAIALGATPPLRAQTLDADPAPVSVARAAASLVEETNAFRRKNRLAPLERNAALDAAAQTFAEYMARTGRYGHEADGKQPAERIEAHGYDYCRIGENIAFTYRSSGFGQRQLSFELMQGWIDSPPHRKNLLEPSFGEIGVGVARSAETGYYYAVQDFGRPKSAAVELSVSNESTERVAYSLGGEKFTLAPHHTRTHRRCAEPMLEFSLPGRRSRSRPAKYTAEPGDRFVVTGMKGSLAIVRR